MIGKFSFHEQIQVATTAESQTYSKADNRKVTSSIIRQILIIHTGGTVGMFRDLNGKFEPQKGRFK